MLGVSCQEVEGTFLLEEILRSTDPVLISCAQALLKAEGIEAVLFDQHSSAIEGSIGAIPRRLMTLREDAAAARQLLREAGLLDGGGRER